MSAPKPEKNTENNPKTSNFSFTDVLGFGKIIEKIPLQKINALMSLGLTFVIVLYSFIGYLYLNKKNINGFPNDWDMRVFTVAGIIIIAVCIHNYIKKNK